MAALVRKLKLRKVALCPQGMNQYADMVLFKSADSLAKDDGEIEVKIEIESEPSPMPEVSRETPLTTAQRLARQQLWDAWWPLWDAFTSSMYELLDMCIGETAPTAAPLLTQSITEFQDEASRILSGLGLIEKAQPLFAACRTIAKAGAKMSAQRMAQLKTAIATLQAILAEAGGAMEKGQPMAEDAALLLKRVEAAEAEVARLTAMLAKAQQTPEEQEVEFMRSLPESLRKKWEAEELEKAALREELRVEKAKREQAEYIEKAASYRAVGLAPDDWEVLKAIDTLADGPRDRILTLLKALGEQLKASALFKELPHGRSTAGDGAEGELQALIAVETAKGASYADAMSAVAKAWPELYAQYTRDIQKRTRV